MATNNIIDPTFAFDGDKQLVWDATSLATYMKGGPFEYTLSILHGFRRPLSLVPLWGTLFHEGMQLLEVTRAKGDLSDAAFLAIIKHLCARAIKENFPSLWVDAPKSQRRLRTFTMLIWLLRQRWVDWHAKAPDYRLVMAHGFPGIEVNLSRPIGNGRHLCGYLDGVYVTNIPTLGEVVSFVDFKSKKGYHNDYGVESFRRTVQFMLYAWMGADLAAEHNLLWDGIWLTAVWIPEVQGDSKRTISPPKIITNYLRYGQHELDTFVRNAHYWIDRAHADWQNGLLTLDSVINNPIWNEACITMYDRNNEAPNAFAALALLPPRLRAEELETRFICQGRWDPLAARTVG